jgi:CRISPR-associated protein Csy3
MAKITASVLAHEKKLVPSEGYLEGTTWENRKNPKERRPLTIIEKSVRGTISNRLKKNLLSDPLKLDAEVEKPNLQTVDSCSLGKDEDTLCLTFTLKFLANVETPSACNNSEFQQHYNRAVKNYIKKSQFTELASRYAENIANGRFLWRNGVGAELKEVSVKIINSKEEHSWLFDCHQFDLKSFSKAESISELAKQIAKALSGETPFLLLKIEAFSKLGMAQEVYPSEELVLDKGRGKKSKILFEKDGIAGMHSQKIGNALRSIDTWYPAYQSEQSVGPIAVEPYGAVTNLGKAFRNPKDGTDFYTLFDKFVANGSLESKKDEDYVMATLVRGGVFGESSKE